MTAHASSDGSKFLVLENIVHITPLRPEFYLIKHKKQNVQRVIYPNHVIKQFYLNQFYF